MDPFLASNDLVLDPETDVWTAADPIEVTYHDGAEQYLRRVIRGATDLASDSFELERAARDWPSEYHLSRARSQLLENFSFHGTRRVLEIGCGCGAITRYLGETFESVVAVEGTVARAEVARLRTRDLPNVAVVGSSFESLIAEPTFDLVVVVGVLEYAASMDPDADRPHDSFLERCAAFLNETGVLMLAIENQLGLPYLAGVPEDHTARRFDGIEDYARDPSGPRTFGRLDLEQRLRRVFGHVAWYYPYPDYKLPDVVLGDDAFDRFDPTDLIAGSIARRDRRGGDPTGFDPALATGVIVRNGAGPLVAPSFLAVAGRAEDDLPRFDGMGAIYSRRRRTELQTKTTITTSADGRAETVKRRRATSPVPDGPWNLRELAEPWIPGDSLALTVQRRSRRTGTSLGELVEPCRPWFERIARDLDSPPDGVPPGCLAGDAFDRRWHNTFVDDRGECTFIDQEWVARDPVPAGVVVARAVYDFFVGADLLTSGRTVVDGLRGRELVRRVAAAHGFVLTDDDIDAFVDTEVALHEFVYAVDAARFRRVLRLQLDHPRWWSAVTSNAVRRTIGRHGVVRGAPRRVASAVRRAVPRR